MMLPVLGIMLHNADRKLKQIRDVTVTVQLYWTYCIVFLVMTSCSYSASLHPDIQMGTG